MVGDAETSSDTSGHSTWCLNPYCDGIVAYFEKLSKLWWLLTLIWFTLATITVAVQKAHPKNLSMLTMYGNLVFGVPLTLPFVICKGFLPLRTYWRRFLLVAVFQAFDLNFANFAVKFVGAAMKTALRDINVVITFFVAALLGADVSAKRCIRSCQWRGKRLLTLSIFLVSAGGFVTFWSSSSDEVPNDDEAGGVALLLASGICYAFKFTCIKTLLCGSEHSHSYMPHKPSVVHINFVAAPLTGLVGLAFALFDAEQTWQTPNVGLILAVAVSFTGCKLCEYRLTELTNPLTVSVLGALHNLVIVLYFTFVGDESMTKPQAYGFAVSSFGAVLYAGNSGRRRVYDESVTSFDTIDSSVEQSFGPVGMSMQRPY